MKAAATIVPRVAALLLASAASLAHAGSAQPDLSAHTDSSVWRLHNRAASAVPDQPNTLRLAPRDNAGIAWLIGSNFSSGTIELDLRGANKPGQSFVGVAFRGTNDDTYEAVYFRPFNFKNPDPARAAHAVQYISLPANDWPALREKFPGKYEAAIAPVPDPDAWFHARIVLSDRTISVFVNDAEKPCLVVDSLADRPSGLIGLWVGNASSGDFGNLKLTAAD
jgi:hypothetical protein